MSRKIMRKGRGSALLETSHNLGLHAANCQVKFPFDDCELVAKEQTSTANHASAQVLLPRLLCDSRELHGGLGLARLEP